MESKPLAPDSNSDASFSLPTSGAARSDVYAMALLRLNSRVGRSITRDEFERFRVACSSCSQSAAINALKSARAGHASQHPTFRKFLRTLDRFLAPLECFKQALDTYAQASDATCLLWGSFKVIITVAEGLREVPELINSTFELLIDSLPIYEEYRSVLQKGNDCPLRAPLAKIYEEYLLFCILVRREAEKSTYKLVLQTTITTREKNDLERCIKVIELQSNIVTKIAISLTFHGVQGIQKTMDTLIKVQLSTNTSFARTMNLTNIPGLLSAKFVGRNFELQWIQEAFRSPEPTNSNRRVGIYGMTGIGKTQLVLKYEEAYRSEYKRRFFITAGSSAKFMESLDHLLDLLDLPEREGSSAALKIAAFKAWLTAHDGWLLLIDNVGEEERSAILDMLPSTPNGHIILTSQRRGAMEKITGRLRLCLELKEPLVDDAVEMFLESREIVKTTENKDLAKRIVKEVGFLPHAVRQSASYIKENGMSLEDYLVHFQKVPDQVLDWEDSYSTKRLTISKHFSMIFQHLQENHQDAAALLRLFSFFEPEAIPIFDQWHRTEDKLMPKSSSTAIKYVSLRNGLLRLICCHCVSSTESSAAPLPLTDSQQKFTNVVDIVQDTDRLYKATAKLVDLNLVRRVSERHNLWIHDLTRFTISKTILEADRMTWLRLALKTAYHAYPEKDNTLKERSIVDTYLAQAKKLVDQARASMIRTSEYIPLMALCAQCMRNRGTYAQAIEWFKIVVPEYEKLFGKSHPRTAAMIHGLALAYHKAGDLKSAESAYIDAWKIRSEVCDENSPEALDTMNGLAACIERQGRLKDGEDIFKKTYEGFKRSLGPSDPVSVAAAHNLALCYANQGRLVEAEALYREALRISEEAFGTEDSGTLKTLGNLAVVVDQSGRLADAEPLYLRALATYSKLRGYEDMLTLRVRSNISGLYRQLGRFHDAEKEIRDALSTFIAIFGPDHFHTATALYDLGEVMQEKGALDEAQRLYTLSLRKMDISSSGHPLAFRVLDALGILYREAGDFVHSDQYTTTAYQKNKGLLGEDDPFTLTSANSRAEYLHSQGQCQEAWNLYHKCLRGFKSLLPVKHPHILMVLNNIGRLSWKMKTKSSIEFFSEAYDGFTTLLGSGHGCSLTVGMNIARSRFAMGDVHEAYELLLGVREGYRNRLGNFHPNVGVADFHLGMLLASKNVTVATTAARGHFQDASDCFIKSFGSQHPNYVMSVCMLIRVLHELEDFDDADAYQSVIETLAVTHKAGTFIALDKPDLTYQELYSLPSALFDWKAVVSLPFGETVRLRWGRKNVWREPQLAVLDV